MSNLYSLPLIICTPMLRHHIVDHQPLAGLLGLSLHRSPYLFTGRCTLTLSRIRSYAQSIVMSIFLTTSSIEAVGCLNRPGDETSISTSWATTSGNDLLMVPASASIFASVSHSNASKVGHCDTTRWSLIHSSFSSSHPWLILVPRTYADDF